ncbi:WAT1-related protein At1g43650-like [Amborella trichopoda]|uniref:WAT1-related protein n=1 Tax=Amborella trichopoda TaxID=13333 RepID=W1PLB2_AMBTC|nr:WAT1-related protein At1g43650-like [Amborella trichopoda]ERN08559.1 hypothetical protein AMTR_s00017p00096360 [Amborella trichopoda]|eukprot:XP_020524440.1 WAT1-related protein At1g43650-like [Amborella trichopoda]
MAIYGPAISQILVRVSFAGMFLITKAALAQGMNTYAFVTYRAALATLTLAPLAYFYEREKRPPLRLKQTLQIFLLGLLGNTITPISYITGLGYTSSTFYATLSNLIPVIISVLAVIFRMEKLQLKKRTGQAKVVGIFLCVGGAMMITLYKGYTLNISSFLKAPKAILKLLDTPHSSIASQKNWILGSILCIISITSWSAWIMYQAAAFKDYPANLSLTALMCFMGTIQCSIISLFMNKPKDWRLEWNLSLFSYTYSGVLCTGIGNLVQTWCIRKKGPVFAATFNPVSTVVVAILEPVLLHVDTHVGSILGAALVIFGLYFVLWAKAKDGKVKANDGLHDCPVKENSTNVEIKVEANDTIHDFPVKENNINVKITDESMVEENNAKGLVPRDVTIAIEGQSKHEEV